MAASTTKKKSTGGRPNRSGAGKGRASQKRSAQQRGKGGRSGQKRPAQQRRPAEPMSFSKLVPVPMQNLLFVVILLMLTLPVGLLLQYVICAVAIGFAVWQMRRRNAAWLWTWTTFIAIGLFLVGVELASLSPYVGFFCIAAWTLVLVALVGEASRTLRKPRGKAAR